MKLGSYVEIINYVEDTAQAGAYYEKFGLKKIADDVYTDGRYHLRVARGDGANPTLRYYGCDLAAIKSAGLDVKDDKITSPQGVVIELTSDNPPLKLPHTDVMLAPDITRLGKFGELSIFVKDLPTEQKFWETCGYITNGVYEDDYRWGIWSDDMFLIGVHQYGDDAPFTITHFHPDMKAVNDALKTEGFDVEPFEDLPDKTVLTHTTLLTPFGVKFNLFTGDISKENP